MEKLLQRVRQKDEVIEKLQRDLKARESDLKANVELLRENAGSAATSPNTQELMAAADTVEELARLRAENEQLKQ